MKLNVAPRPPKYAELFAPYTYTKVQYCYFSSEIYLKERNIEDREALKRY
jgi:hypothetical protein